MAMIFEFSDLFKNLFAPKTHDYFLGKYIDTTSTYHVPEPAYKITTMTYGTKPFYYHSRSSKRWK